MRTVAVIGAGIIGAATAWHLARTGNRVVVLDRAPAPAAGASGASFSRATAFGKAPRDYFRLNQAGLAELHRLHAEGVPGFHPCPSLVWTDDAGGLDDAVAMARARGYDAACARPPALGGAVDPGALPGRVALLPGEGWVDLPAMTAWMLGQAGRHGAEIRLATEVTGLHGDGVRTVVPARGPAVAADVVVNAAGAGGRDIAELAGRCLPLRPTRGLLADVAVPGGLDVMLLAPGVSIRPAGPDTVRVRADEVDDRLNGAAAAGACVSALVGELAGELAERAAALLPGVRRGRPGAVRVGVRAYPADGRSSVGAPAGTPGYYEAVTHSGATLGPLLGRLAAQEITSGDRDPLLAPYPPDRFPAGVQHRRAS